MTPHLGLHPRERLALLFSFSAALTLGLTACGDAEPKLAEDAGMDAALDSGDDGGAAEPNFALRFRAQAGDLPIRCDEPSPGFGLDGDRSAELLDLRFYVHDVELGNADGEFVAAKIVDESPWQTLGVALVDLEDGAGECLNGTAQTRDVITAVVPEGEYSAVRFTVGVPFELNHMDVTLAPSPLNLTRLYWNWRGGYKFLRADLRTIAAGEEAPAPLMAHLGSTGCVSEDAATAPEDECVNPNRATITLEGFDPESSVVVFDLAALFEGMETSSCMSAPADSTCRLPLTRLGLPFGEAPPAMTAFRLEDL